MKYESDIENLIVHKVGQFKNGFFETDKRKCISVLDRVVECRRSDGSIPEEAKIEKAKEVNIEDMSVRQLRAYAKKNKIVVPAGMRAKNDIMKVVLGV